MTIEAWRARVTVRLAAALLLTAAVFDVPTASGAAAELAVGEVTERSAVVWARCAPPDTLRVHLDGRDGDLGRAVDATSDGTAQIALAGLTPATRYRVRAWCGAESGAARGATFRTAPAADVAAPLRFAFGGDVGGQNVCRDAQRGYPIFTQIAGRRPDFFIGLGDMIYADDPCLPIGRYGNAQLPGPPPASDLDGFRAHWRYNRADPPYADLLAQVPLVAVWDDHEIINDAGPHQAVSAAAPGIDLLPPALRAFLEYQPLQPPAGDPTRLYRRLRWGRHLEIFLLDTRQYRSANRAPDGPAKSMLGAAQLAWLEDGLRASDATWKILVASVPLSIPTGSAARDGFASGDTAGGFEREAGHLFALLRAHGIRNHLWITTDVHFATGFVYRPFADDPQWISRELITGPLNAGVFPQLAIDPTFHPERLFLYAPPSPDAITSADAALGWFNFGLIEIDAAGTLTMEVVNGRGESVFRQRLEK